MFLDEKLKEYIEQNVFPQYKKNNTGHQIDHINYVINRCFELGKGKNIDFNMLYVIAAYHDIGYHIDSKKHEIVSAQIMYEDKNLRKFFDEAQLKIMKEAIEDHRASLDREPRNIYGKLVSSADRNIDIDDSLRRIYLYSIDHFNGLSQDETIEECYKHAMKKFSKDGYVKFFFEDEKYKKYLNELRSILDNKEEFVIRLRKLIAETWSESYKWLCY